MQKWTTVCFLLLLFGFVTPGWAANEAAQADILLEKGGSANFKKAAELFETALQADPDNYELNWKCARAFREYGHEVKKSGVNGWQKDCARLGKIGMKYAQKAIDLDPDRAEGYYYYGLNVGIYSDGVSVMTALREGLKGKTQSSIEKAYQIDKNFRNAGPILALGRFWAVVPWPFNNKKKALAYYREYQQTPYFGKVDEGVIYLAELLLKMRKKEDKAEAKTLLEKTAKSPDPYYAGWAQRLLVKYKL